MRLRKEFTAVIGATASGKSALALYLAKRHGGEIVSCDSMQIYRGMDVGTAKPTASEREEIPHHMIDVADPKDPFSAGDFAAMAGGIIDDVIARGKTPIVCGGTFLYLDALTEVSSLSDASCDKELRSELANFAKENGAGALHSMLRKIDPASADAIHENNVKRVIRAIEIYRTTGKTKTEWDAASKEKESPYKAHRLIISYHDRDLLYGRIDRRVDEMISRGLEDEARRLYGRGALAPCTVASQAIGYKEFVDYFEGRASFEEAVEAIKRATRNYAKRQLTWLRRYKDAMTLWGDTESGDARSFDEIGRDAETLLSDAGIEGWK